MFLYKPRIIAIKAIILHTFGVQVTLNPNSFRIEEMRKERVEVERKARLAKEKAQQAGLGFKI